MTTLAFKDGILATDSRMTMDGVVTHDRLHKIRIEDGWCFAVVGALAQAMRFIDALLDRARKNSKASKLPSMEASCNVAELLPTGELRIYEDGGSFLFPAEGFTAYGSGCAPAMAAFHMGACAVQAVGIACKVDPYSGGSIRAVRWQDGKLVRWEVEPTSTQDLLLEGPKA